MSFLVHYRFVRTGKLSHKTGTARRLFMEVDALTLRSFYIIFPK